MYAVMRYDAIVSHAVGPAFPHTLLLIFGVMSMVVAGLLILVQRNLKRLMAYSSVEHMGIIAIGLGLGGPLGLFGALLHIFNHSVGKVASLLSAPATSATTLGRCAWTGSAAWRERMPQTSAALVVGSLAIVGLPPFSLFVSEFAILSRSLHAGALPRGGSVPDRALGGLWRIRLPSPPHALWRARIDVPRMRSCIPSEYSVMGIAGCLSACSSGCGFPTCSAVLLAGSDGGFAMKDERRTLEHLRMDESDSPEVNRSRSLGQGRHAGASGHHFRKPRTERREAGPLHLRRWGPGLSGNRSDGRWSHPFHCARGACSGLV